MAERADMTLAALRQLAVGRRISGASRMRKADLERALAAAVSRSAKDSKASGKAPAKPVATPKPASKAKPAPKVKLDPKAKPTPKAKSSRAKPAPRPVDAPEIVDVVPEAASVWEVTAAKYNLNVAPAIPDEDLGLLPAAYGEDRLILVPRDPEWVFLYWELSDASYRRALALVPGGRVVLRLYVEQDSGTTGVSEQDVGADRRRVYVRARGGDRAMMAELGLRGAGEVFVTMVRSERTLVPAARVRPGAPKFMAVPFDVPLRTLREQGHVAGGRFVDSRGRLLTEAEFHRLFGRAVPGSRHR